MNERYWSWFEGLLFQGHHFCDSLILITVMYFLQVNILWVSKVGHQPRDQLMTVSTCALSACQSCDMHFTNSSQQTFWWAIVREHAFALLATQWSFPSPMQACSCCMYFFLSLYTFQEGLTAGSAWVVQRWKSISLWQLEIRYVLCCRVSEVCSVADHRWWLCMLM